MSDKRSKTDSIHVGSLGIEPVTMRLDQALPIYITEPAAAAENVEHEFHWSADTIEKKKALLREHIADLEAGPVAQARPRCPRVARAVLDTPWAIMPDKLEAIAELIERRAVDGLRMDAERVANIEAARRTATRTQGAVAVLPMLGVLAPRMNLMMEFSGGTSIEQFARDFRAVVANPDVGAIVLDVDSPGGSVSMIAEMADEILKARAEKPIIAVSNTLMASAAYYLASAASEIVVSPSSLTGSIGVVAMHQEFSKMDEAMGVTTTLIYAGERKVDGNEYEPLSDQARDDMQSMVDSYYADFVGAVAKGRGVSRSDVQKNFGQGRVLRAKDAVSAGLADRVDTLDGTIKRLVGKGGGGRARAGASQIEIRRRRLALES